MMKLLAGWLVASCLLPSSLAAPLPQREEARESAPAAEAEAPLTVTGRLHVRRLNGELEPLAEGTLWLKITHPFERPDSRAPRRILRGSSTRDLAVPVLDGSFSFEAPPGTRPLQVLRLEAADLHAVFHPAGIAFEPETEGLSLTAVEVGTTVLRLFSWNTEEAIERGIRVEQLKWVALPAPYSPPRLERETVRNGSRAPLELWPTDLDHLSYLVRAPGFAWTPLTLDPRGGELGMLLEPAGQVVVETVGRSPREAKALRLRRPGGELYLEQPAFNGRVLDVAAGIWEVSLEGWRAENPRVYGSATVTVVEGETTEVNLVLSEVPRVELVPVNGTLVIPSAWERAPSEVVFECLENGGATPRLAIPPTSLVLRDGRSDAFRFDAGGLEPGRYRVSCAESRLKTWFEVPLRPEREVLLEMPPPAKLCVSFVDGADGLPVDPRALLWTLEPPPGWYDSLDHQILPVPRVADGRFEGTVPSGRVELLCWGAPRYRDWSETVELSAEGFTRQVLLERRTGLVLRVIHPEEWPSVTRRVGLEDLEYPVGGRLQAKMSIRNETTYEADAPGTYLLRFTPPPGFAAIPDREVVIESEALTPVEVALVPE